MDGENPLPVIERAIPLQRYKVGEYSATLLGEVESGDGVDYRYILAFVEEGETRPALYVCCDRGRQGTQGASSFRLRIVNDVMSEQLGDCENWRDADRFVQQGLEIGVQALGLGSEQVYRLS